MLQTVKTGEFAVFETTVRGNPNPEVTWFINGHKMDQGSPGVKIEAHNHDHKLTIDSAQYAGTVLCRYALHQTSVNILHFQS